MSRKDFAASVELEQILPLSALEWNSFRNLPK